MLVSASICVFGPTVVLHSNSDVIGVDRPLGRVNLPLCCTASPIKSALQSLSPLHQPFLSPSIWAGDSLVFLDLETGISERTVMGCNEVPPQEGPENINVHIAKQRLGRPEGSSEAN